MLLAAMLLLPVEAGCRAPTDHPWLGLPVAVPDKLRRQRKLGSQGRGPGQAEETLEPVSSAKFSLSRCLVTGQQTG